MSRTIIKCSYCGKPKSIKPSDIRTNNFCNKTCEGLNRRNRVILICNYCNIEFEVREGSARPNNKGVYQRKYCSRECSSAAHSIAYTGKGNPNYKPKIKTCCTHCNSEIEVYPSRYKKSKTHFCNLSCRTFYRRRNWKISPCIICGKFFISHKNGKVKIVCSIKCRLEYYSQTQRGENHWRWMGGSYPDYGPDWENISRQIMKRDNYACQNCGQKHNSNDKRYTLDVHHIIPLRDFDGDYKTANHHSNLISLCKVCHPYVEYGFISIQRPLPLQSSAP